MSLPIFLQLTAAEVEQGTAKLLRFVPPLLMAASVWLVVILLMMTFLLHTEKLNV